MIESSAASVTYLFSDIEGSTRLWEADPARAAHTVAWHDEVSRKAVQRHRGAIVKTTGDGVHAVFEDPADAVAAVIDLQLALAEPGAERALLNVRCGLHLGADQRRDNDFYGPAVNRAARIMSAAHGGQVLLSGAVAERVQGRLPQNVVLRDLGAVRLRDLGSPEHMFQVIHPALRKEFPPLRSMATTPNNLAQQLNSFVGRDRDMAQLQQLLASSRLLTLLGMGGLGKSRLSVQVAAVVLDNYPDGVWFVELASLSDPRLVPQALASVLGVKEEPGGSVIDALARFVREKRLLIVLDNCEHVVQACAELAKRLLEVGPDLKVLASSRDSLRIAGEVVFQVPPLPAPEADAKASVEALLEIDSVKLFVHRAMAVQPAFRLSEESAPAVAEICRRLDGIPLAIELAAARVRVMSVEAIAMRLHDRFRLLNRGDRTAYPRQQTLRALIDWSHDLLEAKEQALFRRLAVFAGGWTLEAAEEIGADQSVERDEILDLLSKLVEKSLVFLEVTSGRYGMLDTVRQYAQEKLACASEDESTRERHLAFFLNLVEKARPKLFGPGQKECLAMLDQERENVLLAHRYCDRAKGGAEFGLRLIFAVKFYWLTRGLLGLGYRVAAEALARTHVESHQLAHCDGLFDAGQLCLFMGRYSEACRHLEQSLAIARELGDQTRVAHALQPLGMAALGEGAVEVARKYLDAALALAREQGDNRQLAAALTNRAQLHRAVGEMAAAVPLYSEAYKLAQELGDRDSMAIVLLNRAMVSIGRNDDVDARICTVRALGIAEELGSRAIGQSVLEVCAGLAAWLEDWERSARLFGAAESQARETGIHRDPGDESFLSPLVGKARVFLGEERFNAAQADGERLSYVDAIAEARAWLNAFD